MKTKETAAEKARVEPPEEAATSAPSMLQHLDGSKHRWLQADRCHYLTVILGDAAREIYHPQLMDKEPTRTLSGAFHDPDRSPAGTEKCRS